MNQTEPSHASDRLQQAHHLYYLGAVHERRLELHDAQRLYEEALALYEEIFGSHHATSGIVTRNLARVLKAQGKNAEGALLDDHAAEILSRLALGSAGATPFGGSAGFYSLIGIDHRLPAVEPAPPLPEDDQAPPAQAAGS